MNEGVFRAMAAAVGHTGICRCFEEMNTLSLCQKALLFCETADSKVLQVLVAFITLFHMCFLELVGNSFAFSSHPTSIFRLYSSGGLLRTRP